MGVSHLFEGYEFQPGVVTYNPYMLNPDDISDIEWLNEDMFQVDYPMGYLLDVGWYGKSCTLNGVFMICIIKDCNWYNTICNEEYRSLTELYAGMKLAIKKINQLIHHSPESI